MKKLVLLSMLFGVVPCSAQIETLLTSKRLAYPLEPEKAIPHKEIRVGLDDLSIPHLASSGSLDSMGFLTFLDLVNITDQTTQLLIVFLDDNGEPVELPLASAGPDGRACLECAPTFARGITVSLKPGESRQQIIMPTGPTLTGWAGVVARPLASAAVTATFMQIVPGRPLFMAGIPPSTILHRRAWLSTADVGGFTTSLALINGDPDESNLMLLEYHRQDGSIGCFEALRIPPFGHAAFLVRDLLPCARGGEGSIAILSSKSFGGLGIWAHDSGGFVTQPLLERR